MGSHFLLQEIFPTQGWNPHLLGLLHWQQGYLPAESPTKPTCIHKNLLNHTHSTFAVYIILITSQAIFFFNFREFPGDPVTRTSYFSVEGMGSIPGWELRSHKSYNAVKKKVVFLKKFKAYKKSK